MKRFANREQAGRLLGERLLSFKDQDPLVLAIPRGGVPVGFEVAKKLKAHLDVLMVKKIGAPKNPEFAVGAVSEDGRIRLNESLIEAKHIDRKALHKIAQQKIKDLRDQLHKLRGSAPPLPVHNRVVILVDDGIATGATLLSAVELLREKGPDKIIVAAPVGAREALHELQVVADEVICLEAPESFKAVGLWYEKFDAVLDDEVIHLLREMSYLKSHGYSDEITLMDGATHLKGSFTEVPQPKALVLFAHGSGSSRLSPRNQYVGRELNKAGFSTLLFDLISEEESKDRRRALDMNLLSKRILRAKDWLMKRYPTPVPMAFIGSDTGAAAALVAAAQSPAGLFAVVCRSGRIDLAGAALSQVKAPTLLIVGSRDEFILKINEKGQKQIPHCELDLVLGADHLFQEHGSLDEAVSAAKDWLEQNLPQPATRPTTKTPAGKAPGKVREKKAEKSPKL